MEQRDGRQRLHGIKYGATNIISSSIWVPIHPSDLILLTGYFSNHELTTNDLMAS